MQKRREGAITKQVEIKFVTARRKRAQPGVSHECSSADFNLIQENIALINSFKENYSLFK